jgi:hypothetical protein
VPGAYAFDSLPGLEMANDSLALPGIDAGPPQEAEYDAVYAAVTATERGRWFLTEFAGRNRHADTDSLIAAIARIAAAVRSDAPEQDSPRRPDISAAAERLADIAFELRQRAADVALCDALDAAVRDICDACKASAEDHRADDDGAKAGAMLVDQKAETTPDHIAPEPARQIAGDAPDASSPSHAELFDMPLQDKEKFAEAAYALAASLSALTGETETASEPQSPSAAVVIPPHDYQAASAPPSAGAPDHGPRWHIEAPDFVFHPPRHEPKWQTVEASGQSSGPHALLAVPQLLPSPDEDPAELFEPAPKRVAMLPPMAPVASAGKPAPTPLASAASAIGQTVRPPAMPTSRNPTGPTVRSLPPRPVPVSPLAALRGLTEEELIALFG